MDATTLFVGLFSGVIGMFYFSVGKKRKRAVMLWSGVALCVYPYLVESVALQIIIGIRLVLLPIFRKE